MADRSHGILPDSSVIIAHFRGKLELFQLISPGEPLFMPLVARDAHFDRIDGLVVIKW